MICLKAEIAIRPGYMLAMVDLLTTRIFPILEAKGGWRMLGCFLQRTGRINTIVDLWELDGYSHFESGYAAFRDAPDYGDIRIALDSYVETETLLFLDRVYGSSDRVPSA